MQKLPDNFEKDFWDLLLPVVTDGTSKNRRNLVVASFIIISIYILNKSFTDLRVFGISLKGSEKSYVLIIAILLIAFWSFMFVVNAVKDIEVNKERRYLLNNNIDKLRESKEHFEDKYSEMDDNHPNKRRMKSIQSEYLIYTQQLERTKKSRFLIIFISAIELGLPFLMSVTAITYLLIDWFSLS